MTRTPDRRYSGCAMALVPFIGGALIVGIVVVGVLLFLVSVTT